MENIKCIIPPKEVLDRLNAIPIYATTPRQSGKTISQKAYIISNKLAQHNPITLSEAWNFVLEYWRDNYGKELTYELVEEEYMKRKESR